MKRILLISLLVAVSLLSVQGCKKEKEDDIQTFTPGSTQAGKAPMTVCTFNIRYPNTSDKNPDGTAAGWSQRRASVKKFIQTVKPELITMQEVNPSQAKDLTSWFSTDYTYYDVGRDSGSGASIVSANCEGVAVMFLKSRFTEVGRGFFWLDENPDTRPKTNTEEGGYGTWASACRRICVWFHLKDKSHGNSDVWFFGAHYDHKSAVAREGAANLMVSRMKSMCNVEDFRETKDVALFHLGDFNIRYDEKNLSNTVNVQLQPLVDALCYARTQAPGTDREVSTYNAYGANAGTIIDHIFYGGKYVKPVKYIVDKNNYGAQYISDHYPVLFKWEYYK